MCSPLAGIAGKTSVSEQRCELQVSILNVSGPTKPDLDKGVGALLRTGRSRLYCTCEIPGRASSLLRTSVVESQSSGSSWDVAWNCTSEVQPYDTGDSIVFTVVEIVDGEQCGSTDDILGRAALTRETLASLAAQTRETLTSVRDFIYDLPLLHSASGTQGTLSVSLSVFPSDLTQRPRSPRPKASISRASSGFSSLSIATEIKSVFAEHTGTTDAKSHAYEGMADNVAKLVAKTLTATLSHILGSHVEGLQKILLTELHRSEQQLLMAIRNLKKCGGRGSHQPLMETIRGSDEHLGSHLNSSDKSSPDRSREVDFEHFRLSAETPHNEHVVSHWLSAGESVNAKRSSAEVDSKRTSHPNDSKASRSSAKHSPGSRVSAARFKSMTDIDSLHTNGILENVGLTSGHSARKSHCRTSVSEASRGVTHDESGSMSEKKAKASHNRRSNSRKSTLESAVTRATEITDDPLTDIDRNTKVSNARKEQLHAMTLGSPSGGEMKDTDSVESVPSRKGSHKAHRSPQAAVKHADGKRSSVSSRASRTSLVEKIQRARVKLQVLTTLKALAPMRIVNVDPDNLSVTNAPLGTSRSQNSIPPVSSGSKTSGLPSSLSSTHTAAWRSGNREEEHDNILPDPDSRRLSHEAVGYSSVARSYVPQSCSLESSRAHAHNNSSDAEALNIPGTDDEVDPKTLSVNSPLDSHLDVDAAFTGGTKPGYYSSQTSQPPGRSVNVAYTGGRESQTMRYLRMEQDELIVARTASQREEPELAMMCSLEDAPFRSWLPSAVLIASGIIPLNMRAADIIFWIQVLLALAVFLCNVKFVADGTNELYSGVASAIVSAGGLFGLFAIRSNSIETILGPKGAPLERFATGRFFYQDWTSKSRKTLYLLLVVWTWSVLFPVCLPLVRPRLECADGILEAEGSSRWPNTWLTKTLNYFAFSYTSALFMVLIYCQFHILACLQLMLDSFCRQLFNEKMLDNFVSEWNVVQAMLRSSSRSVENCFVIVQTCSLCALVLSAVGIWRDAPRICGSEWIMLAMDHTPILILALVAMILFSKAAAVTEQCTRVPSLINSIEMEDPVDETRQYVVTYIINSNAGFYVRDVRLTSYMALKIFYVIFAAMVGLVVQMLRM